MTEAWRALDAELDLWAAVGLSAALWWRDDDAATASDQLARLLTLAEEGGAPLCLAVSPALCQPALVEALNRSGAKTSVAVHGWAHLNHAETGEKKSEFPPGRDLAAMRGEVARGLESHRQSFGKRALDVFAPPWNRAGGQLIASLPAAGYRGYSAYAPRSSPAPVAGLRQVNTHIDIIDWGNEKAFAGATACLQGVVGHLAARRRKSVDSEEPTGLLSHHLAQPDEAFDFIAQLLRRINDHPAARWLDGREVFKLA
jgi:hypothetical protein